MRKPTTARSLTTATAMLLVGLTASSARADDKQACLDAYDKAQTLRLDDDLLGSREQLLVCARTQCPGIVRKDCTEWLSEVEKAIPTVVLAAQLPDGRDAVDVRVTLDGRPFIDQIDGKAMPVNPGVHVFVFEAPGFDPVELKLVVYAAAKNRRVTARFERKEVPSGGQETQPEAGGSGGAAIPTAAYLLGGVGLVGLGGFAYFGMQFDGQLDDMDACKPNCPQSDADDAAQTRVLALVSGGVGLVALGIGTYLAVDARASGEPPTEPTLGKLDIVPVHGGAMGLLGGSF